MTSQKWLTPQDWNRGPSDTNPNALWWHWMVLVVPDKLDPKHTDVAFLWITGGSNNNGPPTDPYSEDNSILAALCMDMGVVGAVLYQIPNQPIYFTDENPPKGRSEDAFIAWTWNHFLQQPGAPNTLTWESEWLARLPMTKGAVKAMDTVQNLIPAVKHFVVAGASKRGWTTWTTGLTDARVVAIIPIVLDVLHMIPSLHHMWRAYGGWTYTFKDYYAVNLTQHLDDDQFLMLSQIEDPYYYIQDPTRFLMPKLVINAVGDEFLQNDNDFYWWDVMPRGQGLFRQMCQNAEHSEATGIPNIMHDISAWGNAWLQGAQWPNFTWTIDPNDGHITVFNDPTKGRPINVTLWYANNYHVHGNRDWRFFGGYPTQTFQPVFWKHMSLPETTPGSNVWLAYMIPPTVGWMGFFVEVFYDGPAPFYDQKKVSQYRLTTQVSLIPKNKWPYPDCYGYGCYGELM